MCSAAGVLYSLRKRFFRICWPLRWQYFAVKTLACFGNQVIGLPGPYTTAVGIGARDVFSILDESDLQDGSAMIEPSDLGSIQGENASQA